MLVAYKTEINPTEEQKKIINRTIGVVRYIKNMYLAHNSEVYQNGGSFVSAYTFSEWLNNTYIPMHEEKCWIKDVYAKAVKQGLMDTEKAFRRFFSGVSNYPTFKKKARQDVRMYFVRNGAKQPIECERHRIKIPTLGWIRLKEKGYIPKNNERHTIKSGKISRKADRYYISILVEQSETTSVLNEEPNYGIGIDLGLKEFATTSSGDVYKNINKTSRVRKLEKKLRREQRKLSRKYEAEKLRTKNTKKGEPTRSNTQKQTIKVQRLHQQLANIRQDYQNKIVAELVKTKPAYITVEDLNVKGMMKNRHLSRAIGQQGFYTFKDKLIVKAKQYGIEVREVDRFYPSSKLCKDCGQIKKDLKLSDRIYHCDCGYQADRDLNASLNLRDAKHYKVLA